MNHAACAILMDAEHRGSNEPVSIRTGQEITIQDLAHLIADEVGYKGKLCGTPATQTGNPGGASIRSGRSNYSDSMRRSDWAREYRKP